MIRNLRPRFLTKIWKNLRRWHSRREHIFTIRYDIQSWTPPTLAPLPREHSPERRRARDIRSGESDRLRVRVVRAMLCGLWTLRRNVDKSADAELCVRHEISAKFASDGRNLREEICGAPKKNPRPCQWVCECGAGSGLTFLNINAIILPSHAHITHR